MAVSEKVWPVELRLKRADKILEIDFDNGRTFALSAEYLRVNSPSAETKHRPHHNNKKDIVMTAVEPVGNYAVRIYFDDLHQTGLYSWRYLYELGEKQNG